MLRNQNSRALGRQGLKYPTDSFGTTGRRPDKDQFFCCTVGLQFNFCRPSWLRLAMTPSDLMSCHGGSSDLFCNQITVFKQALANPQFGFGDKVYRAELQRPDGDIRITLSQ